MLIFSSLFITVYSLVFAFILGSVMGSALNCLAWRLVRGEKWSGNNRSRCPACGHVLGLPDLIPVFSWLFLRGRCRHCGAPVSPRYLITELISGVSFCLIILRYDISAFALTALILFCCLLCLSLVDMDSFEIPDRFIIIPAAVRIIYVFFFGAGGHSGLIDAFVAPVFGAGGRPGVGHFLTEGLLSVWYCLWHGLIMGGALLLLALFMDKVLKRESMGGGDIKLIGMLGLWFSLPECLLMLLLSCLCGLIFAAVFAKAGAKKENSEEAEETSVETAETSEDDDSRGRFPFGPSVAMAALITLLCGSYIVNLYLGLFS